MLHAATKFGRFWRLSTVHFCGFAISWHARKTKDYISRVKKQKEAQPAKGFQHEGKCRIRVEILTQAVLVGDF